MLRSDHKRMPLSDCVSNFFRLDKWQNTESTLFPASFIFKSTKMKPPEGR